MLIGHDAVGSREPRIGSVLEVADFPQSFRGTWKESRSGRSISEGTGTKARRSLLHGADRDGPARIEAV